MLTESYHSIPSLGIKGSRDVEDYWKKYKLPEDLTGMLVLDIGTWTGGFAIKAKKLGASHVVAIDNFNATAPRLADTIEVIQRSGEDITVKALSIYDSKFESVFDVVFFLQVFYHLTNPFAGLVKAVNAAKIGGYIWIECRTDPRDEMLMYPYFDEVNTDYWLPTASCMEFLFKRLGVSFERCWSHGKLRHCWKCRKEKTIRYNENGLLVNIKPEQPNGVCF